MINIITHSSIILKSDWLSYTINPNTASKEYNTVIPGRIKLKNLFLFFELIYPIEVSQWYM